MSVCLSVRLSVCLSVCVCVCVCVCGQSGHGVVDRGSEALAGLDGEN